MGRGEDSAAATSIRHAVCRNYFSGDGECPSCHHQPECEILVDEALGLVSDLAGKRKSDQVKNSS